VLTKNPKMGAQKPKCSALLLGIVADALLELGSMQQQHVLVHK
jgi:hypothetical protein